MTNDAGFLWQNPNILSDEQRASVSVTVPENGAGGRSVTEISCLSRMITDPAKGMRNLRFDFASLDHNPRDLANVFCGS